MAKFLCPCGEELSDSREENIRLHAWSHLGWEKLSDDIQDAISFKPRTSTFFAKSEFDIWHCPKCERLHFFEMEGNLLKTYAIEAIIDDNQESSARNFSWMSGSLTPSQPPPSRGRG